MFLALKEIRHEKLRYGLIIGMILMISYLVYVLSGLAFGLAQQNTQAIDSWSAKSVVLDRDANTSLSQSLITSKTANRLSLNDQQAYLGQAGIVAKTRPSAEHVRTVSGNQSTTIHLSEFEAD